MLLKYPESPNFIRGCRCVEWYNWTKTLRLHQRCQKNRSWILGSVAAKGTDSNLRICVTEIVCIEVDFFPKSTILHYFTRVAEWGIFFLRTRSLCNSTHCVHSGWEMN